MSRRIWDISERVEPETATFPGDNAFSLEWVMRKEDGASCNVSTIRMSVHVGTHTDAPLHYDTDGADMASVDMHKYIGRCRVMDVQAEGSPPLIPAAALTPELLDGAERVLLRTCKDHNSRIFDPDFTSLGGAAAKVLADAGIQLVGIDTPSMDHSTQLPVGPTQHQSRLLAGPRMDPLRFCLPARALSPSPCKASISYRRSAMRAPCPDHSRPFHE